MPGIGGFFTPTSYGTELATRPDGTPKETREINGRMYVFEEPLHGDLALIKAERGDRWGNLTYRKVARNFGPIMAMAAKRTVATVYHIDDLGQIDPEIIITPGIFVTKHCLYSAPSPPNRADLCQDKIRAFIMTLQKRTKETLAKIIAADIPEGAYVNLGIGMPTLIADHIDPAIEVILHSENGMLGMGTRSGGGQRGLRPYQCRQASRDLGRGWCLFSPCR